MKDIGDWYKHIDMMRLAQNTDTWDISGNIAFMLANFFWSLYKALTELCIYVLRIAFDVDFINAFGDMIQEFIQKFVGYNGSYMNNGLLPTFLTLIFLIVIAELFYYYSKRDYSGMFVQIFLTIAILVGSFFFYTNIGTVIKTVNTVTTEISSVVIGLTTDVQYDEDGEPLSIGEQIEIAAKEELLFKPWLHLNFGVTDIEALNEANQQDQTKLTGAARVKLFLETEGDLAKLADTEVTQYKNKAMSRDHNPWGRASDAILLFFTSIPSAAVFIMIGIVVFAAKVMIVVFILILPIPLTMALIPSKRMGLITYLNKILGNQIEVISMGLVVSVLLFTSSILKSAIATMPDMTFAKSQLLVTIIYCVFWWKRKEFFGPAMVLGGTIKTKYNEAVQYARTHRQDKFYRNGNNTNGPDNKPEPKDPPNKPPSKPKGATLSKTPSRAEFRKNKGKLVAGAAATAKNARNTVQAGNAKAKAATSAVSAAANKKNSVKTDKPRKPRTLPPMAKVTPKENIRPRSVVTDSLLSKPTPAKPLYYTENGGTDKKYVNNKKGDQS
ncbi:CD3337/EF1877 family mobilome membrane protein [Culicoidibacter larvae]|uniref:Type IV secretion system protein n=1 Tax=Culicoidibacter larvae TaxID=2579976 RepID=A0A5R8QHS4_9FIRM|nr:type IV secretion system protein [Culicoidibacter larvae]TLG77344.1 type IV secretion system protein [Culicoidibacter larvae]